MNESNDKSQKCGLDILKDTRLTTGEAARELQLAPGTLQNWRSLGVGPKFIKHRRNVCYLLSDIVAYIEENYEFYNCTSDWKKKHL